MAGKSVLSWYELDLGGVGGGVGNGTPEESLDAKLGESGGGGGRSYSFSMSSGTSMRLTLEAEGFPPLDILTGLITRLPWMIVLSMI